MVDDPKQYTVILHSDSYTDPTWYHVPAKDEVDAVKKARQRYLQEDGAGCGDIYVDFLIAGYAEFLDY